MKVTSFLANHCRLKIKQELGMKVGLVSFPLLLHLAPMDHVCVTDDCI